MVIKVRTNQEPISLGNSEGRQPRQGEITTLPDSPQPRRSVGPGSASPSPDGVSAFFARILNQLTLSTWLPAAFFTVSVAALVQFRNTGSVSAQALTVDPMRMLLVIIPLLVMTTVAMQAFSFEAIRILEGYWRRRGIASLARTLMIRRHLHRKLAIANRRHKASETAFYAARHRMLKNGIPFQIVNAVEAQILRIEPPSLTGEESAKLARINWRSSCDAWHLARIDHLLNEEKAYPATSRILPTKLGNLIRATEDRLKTTDDDLEGFALQRYAMVPSPVQRQHDRFRSRLGMYCHLVFASAALLILTPVILLGSHIDDVAVATISCTFAVISWASYLAALSSASGYCLTLNQMDQTSRSLQGS